MDERQFNATKGDKRLVAMMKWVNKTHERWSIRRELSERDGR